MSGLEQFQIFLDNPQAVYYSGQTVSGHVDIQLASVKKLRGVQVKFKGEAEVRWTERRTTRRHNRTHTSHDTYYATEQYFNAEQYVLGGPGNEMILAVGKHVFPFNIVLPPGLPLSFEGEYGHVRYTIKAIIDRPWKFNHEAKVIFTVIQHLDLNAELTVKEPVRQSAEKYLCCLCCKSGPISVAVSVPITGYVAGQLIPMTVLAENASNQTVEVVATLIQVTAFRATRKTRHTENKVAELNIGSVSIQSSDTWEQGLMVPPVPPSYLRNCNIIDISYNLQVKACISGPHVNLDVKIPIVIGTIPLASCYQTPPPPSEAWGPQPSAPNYSDISPPSYEECIYGRRETQDQDDNEYTRGDKGFAPRYPTYQFGK